MSLLNGFFRWSTPLLLFIVLALRSGMATAQVPPIMVIDDASVCEGNAGTKVLVLPVRFVGAQPATVTGKVSAIPLTGAGFNPANGGSACGGSVDFVQFTNVDFSIPPNTPNGTLSVNIAVCGDTAIEPNEQIFVFFSNVSGANCSLEGTCNAVGTILNDDGPPRISINDISTSEPVISGAQKNTAFTVSLQCQSSVNTTVTYATRDGTAKATGVKPDYFSRSGTLTIPAGALTGTITVPILGDQIAEPSQTFFVDLTNPVNGTFADSVGQCTIRDTTLTTGGFDLSPDNARVRVGDMVNYAVVWTVPEGEVWRDLMALDFRLRRGNKTALWVHWEEDGNTFSVCQRAGKTGKGDDDDADVGPGSGVICTPGEAPGSPAVLETPFGQLHLAESTVVGSGPTGRSVTLNLAISPGPKTHGHYGVELAAADDLGGQDDFVHAGDLHIRPAGPR